MGGQLCICLLQFFLKKCFQYNCCTSYHFLHFGIFQGDLRTMLFQVCPYGGRPTRPRHGAVKWKARNHMREDINSYDKDNPLKRGLLERSATEYRNGNASASSSCSKETVGKTLSTKSF